MKKLLVVVGLSAIAMAGKCSSDKSTTSETKAQEEFPVKEESQVPAGEVPSYEQQTTPAPTDGTTTPTDGTTTTPSTPEATPAPGSETAPTPTPAP